MKSRSRIAMQIVFFGFVLFTSWVGAETTDAPNTEQQTREALNKAWSAKDWPQALLHVDALLKFDLKNANYPRWKGFILGEMGRAEEAIPYYRRSTELAPKEEGTWSGLCWRLIEAQQLKEASTACERSVSIKKTYVNTVNLGHTYLLAGDTNTAYRWYRETLGLVKSEKDLQEGLLADFDLFIQKGWKAAESLKARQWMEALQSTKKRLIQVIDLQRKGNYAQALPLALQNLEVAEKYLSTERGDLAQHLNQLAMIYNGMDRVEEAIPYYRRSTELEPNDWGSWNGLCKALIKAQQFNVARPACERSVRIKKTLENTANLGHTYLFSGDTETAYHWYRETLLELGKHYSDKPLKDFDLFIQKGWRVTESQKAKQWLNEGNSQYFEAQSLIGQASALNDGRYHPDEHYAKGIPQLERALVILEKLFGPEHPKTGEILNRLGLIYKSIRKDDKAQPLFQRAWAISEKANGPDHYDTDAYLSNLTSVYKSMGQYAKALPGYKRKLALREEAYGPDHIEIVPQLPPPNGRAMTSNPTWSYSLLVKAV